MCAHVMRYAYNTICLIIDVKYKILINYYSLILHDNSQTYRLMCQLFICNTLLSEFIKCLQVIINILQIYTLSCSNLPVDLQQLFWKTLETRQHRPYPEMGGKM